MKDDTRKMEFIEAVHSTLKNYKPYVERDGSIKGTPLQSILKFKVGAEIMLTFNIDTCNGLTNGAFGKVLGFDFYQNNTLILIFIEFYIERVGRERRKKMYSISKLISRTKS